MRRPKLIQWIPDGPQPIFQVVERTPGDSYFEFKLSDFQDEYAPTLRYLPSKRGASFTTQQLANAAAGHLAEARGRVVVTEVRDGIPVFSAIFVADGHHVLCAWSTDRARQPIEIRA